MCQCYLQTFIHRRSYIRGCLEHRLVIEHHAHVTIHLYQGLLHPVETKREVGGYHIDAPYLLLGKQTLGFSHIGDLVADRHVGAGITAAQEVAALAGLCQVDGCHRHLTYHLIVVDPRVEEGISQRDDDHKEHHTLVFQDGTEFVHPHVTYLANDVACLFHLSFFFSDGEEPSSRFSFIRYR